MSALSLALNGLGSYSNVRGAPDMASATVDVPRTTTDSLTPGTLPQPGTSAPSGYRLSMSPASVSPAPSSSSTRSPQLVPASPGSTAAAQVLANTRWHAIPKSIPSSRRRLSSNASASHSGTPYLAGSHTPHMSGTSLSANASSLSQAALGATPTSVGSSRSFLKDRERDSPPTSASGPLNTNSPVALAAAAAVTPEKLSRFLMTHGPLSMRHITMHLAQNISGFADLSLSKQRRLIISALDAGDPANNIVFEKVGWGRWSARRTDPLTGRKHRGSISAELNSVRPPSSPLLAASDRAVTGDGVTSVWADDVSLADDDMMFHNSVDRPKFRLSRLSGTRTRRASERMRERVAFRDDDDDGYADVFDDSDDDDDSDELTEDPSDEVPIKHGETDDEDWQSIGAVGLRSKDDREKLAVDALVELRSI